jgi:hypothetical protein
MEPVPKLVVMEPTHCFALGEKVKKVKKSKIFEKLIEIFEMRCYTIIVDFFTRNSCMKTAYSSKNTLFRRYVPTGFFRAFEHSKWLYAAIVVVTAMWLGGCDMLAGLSGDDAGDNGGGEDVPIVESGSLRFYVSATGDDDNNNGLSEDSSFKTLTKAYVAALVSQNRKRIVVLSDLDNNGPDTLDASGTVSEPVVIEGSTSEWKIERNDGRDSSVLEIKGGARIVFKNITINGKISDDDGAAQNNRALWINGTGTKVTLGDGVVVTGQIATSSSSSTPNTKDGSGILIGGNAELEMTGDSQVTGCKTTAGNYAKGAVVVYGGGMFTMKDCAAVNGNTISTNVASNISSYGGGVYVHGGIFEMGDSAVVSENTVTTDSAYGSGVAVASGGSFTMKGSAAVSGNTVTGNTGNGGGVYICDNGSFMMKDNATISGNTVTGSVSGGYGGGVYLADNGTFEMTGGKINGNEAAGSPYGYGGGVMQEGVSFFKMFTGIIYGNTADNGSAYRSVGNNFTVEPMLLPYMTGTPTINVLNESIIVG